MRSAIILSVLVVPSFACSARGADPPPSFGERSDDAGRSVHPDRVDGGPLDRDGAAPDPDGGFLASEDGSTPTSSDGGGDPVPLGGDTCATPIALSLGDGPVVVRGTTIGAAHDYDGPPACAIGRTTLDVVYTMNVPAGHTLRATYTGPGSNVCLSTQSACPDTSLIGGCTCGDPTIGLTREKTYDADTDVYLFVWAADPGSEFDLELELVPGA